MGRSALIWALTRTESIRVEVLKGPAALMVGPDALAGAIIFTG